MLVPTGALQVPERGPQFDIGPAASFAAIALLLARASAITFTRDWRLAASTREDLVVTGDRPFRVDALGRSFNAS